MSTKKQAQGIGAHDTPVSAIAIIKKSKLLHFRLKGFATFHFFNRLYCDSITARPTIPGGGVFGPFTVEASTKNNVPLTGVRLWTPA